MKGTTNLELCQLLIVFSIRRDSAGHRSNHEPPAKEIRSRLRPRAASPRRRREQPGAGVSRRGRHAAVHPAGGGRAHLGHRRQRVHRLRGVVGADGRWARSSESRRSRTRGSGARHELRGADGSRNRTGRTRLRAGAVNREAAVCLQRHRSNDERHPPGARRDRARRDHQAGRLLPRRVGFAAGQGRLGRAHPGPAR